MPKFYAADRHGTQLGNDDAMLGLLDRSILQNYDFWKHCERKPCLPPPHKLPLWFFEQLWYKSQDGQLHDVHGICDPMHGVGNDDRQVHTSRCMSKRINSAFICRAVGLERGLPFRAYDSFAKMVLWDVQNSSRK